jgi:hypothetical protein
LPRRCKLRERRKTFCINLRDLRECERGGPELIEDAGGDALEPVGEDRAVARNEGRFRAVECRGPEVLPLLTFMWVEGAAGTG